MITFEDQINEDLLCLAHYFEKMFSLLEDAKSTEAKVPMTVRDGTEAYAPRVQISHLIKPDMLINIYAIFDFWIKRLCDNKKKICNLELGWKDINGDNDPQRYHKYLTKYAGMNLDNLNRDYQGIQSLRSIRNKYIHAGGHVFDEKDMSKMKSIKGITIDIGTIVIHDEFVWSSLDNVEKYLIEIAEDQT